MTAESELLCRHRNSTLAIRWKTRVFLLLFFSSAYIKILFIHFTVGVFVVCLPSWSAFVYLHANACTAQTQKVGYVSLCTHLYCHHMSDLYPPAESRAVAMATLGYCAAGITSIAAENISRVNEQMCFCSAAVFCWCFGGLREREKEGEVAVGWTNESCRLGFVHSPSATQDIHTMVRSLLGMGVLGVFQPRLMGPINCH